MVGYVIGDVIDNPLSLSCKQTNNEDYLWNKLPNRQMLYEKENYISKIILCFPFDLMNSRVWFNETKGTYEKGIFSIESLGIFKILQYFKFL